MTTIDLVTGFLGAGKTTFILDYARELIRRGERIGIIENDYGAINVDLMLLHRELGDQCRLEMVIGGDPDCHRRRLKTKLIAMGIDRYDRVIVEPSGVFDVDEFMDLLYEEPLDRMLSLGNVLAVVDAASEFSGEGRSEDARYVLAEELTRAGCVIYSKAEQMDDPSLEQVTEYLNKCLADVGCKRILTGSDVLRKPEGGFQEADWNRLMGAGSREYSYVKRTVLTDGDFQSVFFFHVELPADGQTERKSTERPERQSAEHPEQDGAAEQASMNEIRNLIHRIFADPSCGSLTRIKGFTAQPEGDWLEINATREKISLARSPVGQPVVIAIGEGLDQERIGSYWKKYENEYRSPRGE